MFMEGLDTWFALANLWKHFNFLGILGMEYFNDPTLTCSKYQFQVFLPCAMKDPIDSNSDIFLSWETRRKYKYLNKWNSGN